jgi:hypothetical protein
VLRGLVDLATVVPWMISRSSRSTIVVIENAVPLRR